MAFPATRGQEMKKKSESGDVALQNKVKSVKTNMQAKTKTLHPPLTSVVGLKGRILKL